MEKNWRWETPAISEEVHVYMGEFHVAILWLDFLEQR